MWRHLYGTRRLPAQLQHVASDSYDTSRGLEVVLRSPEDAEWYMKHELHFCKVCTKLGMLRVDLMVCGSPFGWWIMEEVGNKLAVATPTRAVVKAMFGTALTCDEVGKKKILLQYLRSKTEVEYRLCMYRMSALGRLFILSS